MRKYKLIGLTGTTGAGKGQVRKIFESQGYVSVDADFLARKITENPVVLKTLCCHFGDDILENNALNRKLLASRAFKDKEHTRLLNSITHPFIIALFIKEIEKISKNADRIIFDAPQLFESHLNAICDVTVAVTADKDIRIKRITGRDNISRETAQKRINAQYTDSFFADNCDYIIENNGDLETLKTTTLEIISRI